MNKKLSYILVTITALLWGTSASVSKILLANLDSLQLTFYYSLFATLALFIFSIFKGKVKIIKTYKVKDYLFFAIMGALGIFLYDIFLLQAFLKSPVQEAYIVNYTYPIWTIIFAAILLKDKLNLGKIIAIFLGFLGVYITVTKGALLDFTFSSIEGLIYALLAALFYGLFSVIGKKKNYDTITSMLFYYVFALIFISVIVGLYSSFPVLNIHELLGVIWMGVFVNAIAYVCWFLAMKYGDTNELSNIIFITPFLSLVFIYFFTGENILISSFVGLMFIVLGIIIQSKINFFGK